MYIRDLFEEDRALISLEIFPPKPDGELGTIYDTIFKLKDLNPNFISVTYGAGGSTKDKTVQISSFVHEISRVTSLAHMTCLSSTKEEIDSTLENLKDNGVKNVLALRGDYPQDGYSGNHEFKYASDLVAHIKKSYDFCIGGACYPEGHVECDNIDKDIENLKIKVDNGVDFLISQLFFDNDAFYNFRDKAQKKNINIPIIAGVLPILNKKQVARIIKLTGCSIPEKIKRILDKYEYSSKALKEAGLAYATDQIVDLVTYDTAGIHLYTMNKTNEARRILDNIKEIRGVVGG